MNRLGSKKGIALVSVMTVLTVVSLLCIYFLSALKLQTNKDVLYINQNRADFLARAGIQYAIAKLKYGTDGVRGNFTDTRLEDWFYKAGAGTDLEDAAPDQCSFAGASELEVLFGRGLTGEIKIKVLDAASQINLNDKNPNIADLLEKLPGITSAMSAGIIAKKPLFEEEIRTVNGMDTVFDNIKDFVTVYSWSDPKAANGYSKANDKTSVSGDSNEDRSPVNVNTAPVSVLEAVLDSYSSVTSSDAATVAAAIDIRVATDPFYRWQDFNDFIDNIAGLSRSTKISIKNSANPNRLKSTTTTNPAYSSTEFCFHGGGSFEIEVIARLYRKVGGTVARKRIKAQVDIADFLQHTLKSDFRDENSDNQAGGEDAAIGKLDWDGSGLIENRNFCKVSWLDSCPVDEADDREEHKNKYSCADPDDLEGMSPYPYRTIVDSVKLGFWDNFDEDSDNNQSLAWWGNEKAEMPFIRDVGANYEYSYLPTDYSEADPPGNKIMSWPEGAPDPSKRHSYNDVSPGANAYWLDDSDNELWVAGNASASLDAYASSKFYLGGRKNNNGKLNGEAKETIVKPAYRKWNAIGGFYFRCFSYDGPRASVGTPGNFPGFICQEYVNSDWADRDPAGRGNDSGCQVSMFKPGIDSVSFFVYPFSNVYTTVPPIEAKKAPPQGNYIYYEHDGPAFYISAVTQSRRYYEDKGVRYQRDKVYKLTCVGMELEWFYYASGMGGDHVFSKKKFGVNIRYEGYIELYSAAIRGAWDDVRVIDTDGRYANRFIFDSADLDVGCLHADIYFPPGGGAFFAGNDLSGKPRVGAVTINLASYSKESEFLTEDTSSAYYPDLDYEDMLQGAQVIKGPDYDGKVSCSYSVMLTGEINDDEPKVPALNEVKVSFMPATKVRYCYSS